MLKCIPGHHDGYAYYPTTVGDDARTPIHIHRVCALMLELQVAPNYIYAVENAGNMYL